MSDVPEHLVVELLTESLAAWRVSGQVRRADDGGIVVHCNDKSIRIDANSPGNMFRWMVTIDGRQKPAISLVAVLRQVRQALDANYLASRVRITVAPLVPLP